MSDTVRHATIAALFVGLCACTPTAYRPDPLDPSFRAPAGSSLRSVPTDEPPLQASAAPQPTTALELGEVLASVTNRYPPYLSALLERDLASGRLLSAMGNFDTVLGGKVGGNAQGYYEATAAEATLEQPLVSGDTLYGGYRISNGFLPDYDKNRTQDGGELFVGGRIPLLRNRSIDRRRASVRQAQIDVELADPTIARARIDFVRAAARAYYGWVAAGQRLSVAQELLQVAEARVAGLQRGVDLQFVAAIDVTDNTRLIAQRRVFVTRAERLLQQAALELSLFLRDADDAPIEPDAKRLPPQDAATRLPDPATLQRDTELAILQRPELRRLQLQRDRVQTDRDLAENATLPDLDFLVEATRTGSDRPYGDQNRDTLFIGGELKLPIWRRDAKGRVEQATTQLSRLELETRFARDRVVNEIADVRSALRAAHEQIAAAQQNVELARTMVTAEQRALELGRGDLFRVQQRELQLAEARTLEIDALLEYHRSVADYRAALSSDGVAVAADRR